MKKFIYTVIMAVIILSGCEYNPYYDGQDFCVYDKTYGMLETDGMHIYVPMPDKDPYVLEFYGGKGKSHKISIADPECLRYTYIESDIKTAPFDVTQITPAGITLLPQKTCDTSIKIEDLDTGESLEINVHICDSFQAVEVSEGCASFEKGTVFAFRYGGEDKRVRICRGNVSERELEYIVEGNYEFAAVDDSLYFELKYPADEAGKPTAAGMECTRTYQILHIDGSMDDPWWMMQLLNLENLPIETRSYYVPDRYDASLRFVNEQEEFTVNSAMIIPWFFD